MPSQGTFHAGYHAIGLHLATNGFGMHLIGWAMYLMEHMKQSGLISERTPTILKSICSSLTEKILLYWIGVSKVLDPIWKTM